MTRDRASLSLSVCLYIGNLALSALTVVKRDGLADRHIDMDMIIMCPQWMWFQIELKGALKSTIISLSMENQGKIGSSQNEEKSN